MSTQPHFSGHVHEGFSHIRIVRVWNFTRILWQQR
jgi:hypothetical protein